MKKILPVIIILISLILTIPAFAYITGLSKVDVQIDNVFGDGGKLWLLEWNGLTADKISGTMSASELTAEAGADGKTDQSFTLSMDTSDEYIVYKFSQDPTLRPITKVELISKEYWFWEKSYADMQTEAKSVCVDISTYGNSIVYKTYGSLNTHYGYYCAKWSEQLGTTTNIKNPFVHFKTDWSLAVSGQTTLTTTISSDQNVGSGTSTKLGNNILIQWQGSLVSGITPPTPGGKVLGLHSNTFGWRVIDDKNYDTWNNYLQNSLINCIFDWAWEKTTKASCESASNQKATQGVISTQNEEFIGYQISDTTFTNGQFKIIPKDFKITIPSFRILIDGDYLKLVIPTGKPSIVSITSPKFREDGTGHIDATIKNIGSGDGYFESRIISCTEGFEPSYQTNTQLFKTGEQKTISLYLSGSSTSTTKTITGTCTVEVKDTTSQEKATKDVSVSFDQVTECIAGNRRKAICGSGESCTPGNWVVKECNADGMTEKIILECKANEELEFVGDSNYKCVQVGGCDKFTTQVTCIAGGCDWCSESSSCAEDCGGVVTCAKEGESPKLNQKCCSGLELKGAFLGFIGGTCQKPDPYEWLISILPYIVITLLFAVGIAMVVKKKNRILGLIFGALIGIMISLVLVWVTQNWIVVALGMVGAGLLLYFFGGGLLIFILLLIKSWRKS